ncbi:Ribosomal RNA small subunit methyltransferase H [Bienertia sinuspersici]
MDSYHTRSFSSPSISHPVADQLDEQLCRLRSSQTASTSSLTSKLISLKDLYKSVEEFHQLPQNQKTQSEHWVEGVLDGSLRLLHICSTSQDVLVQSKEQLQDIQSTLRRCIGEGNMTNEFAGYLKNRKIAKKAIKKCLKDIKEIEKTNEAIVVESKLIEVQAMTVDVFKSLLSYIGGSEKSSWSFSKLVRQKAEKETAAPISKFEAVDATLELICQKKTANVDMSQIVQLESEIQEIDEVLQCLFRHLVKTRATLLNLSRLRSSQAVSTSSSLNQTLTNLKDLYCSFDELLQLPLNQQAVSQNVNSKWIEEVLEESLRLLDICGTSRDVLVQSKECLQDIQSVLRRRCSGELNITNEVAQYLNTRKSAKKMIKKSLKNIKETEKTNKDNAIETMLKDVSTMTLDVFKSTLSYIGGSNVGLQKISKLMHHGNKEATTTNNEFDVVDATLESTIHQKNKNGVENLRSELMTMESDIQSLDEALDSLFRHLVKTRATLLNILTVDQLDEQLSRLRSSQTASTSSLTSKLMGLRDVYKSVDEFLQLPQNQITQSELEEVLDGSLRLLDICSTSQDVLIQSTEQLQNIQLVLRRRCSGEINMNSEFAEYLQSRKSAKKMIKKSLKDIKEVEKTNETIAIESMLKDVHAITADVFKSLLSYIAGSQKSSWSFSKLVGQKTEKETAAPISKFEAVDATIELICQKKKANVDMSQVVQLEYEVQEINEVLQCLFRHLIKTRATLLNVHKI